MVDQHTAWHPALLRTNQRVDHLAAGGVIGERVILDVDVALCALDRLNDGVDRAGIIGEQLNAIAGEGWQATEVGVEPDQRRKAGRDERIEQFLQREQLSGVDDGFAQDIVHCALLGAAAP